MYQIWCINPGSYYHPSRNGITKINIMIMLFYLPLNRVADPRKSIPWNLFTPGMRFGYTYPFNWTDREGVLFLKWHTEDLKRRYIGTWMINLLRQRGICIRLNYCLPTDGTHLRW